MASTYSVTSNHYLRLIYTGNTDVMKKADREDKSSYRLSTADSKALRKGLQQLRDYRIPDDESDVSDAKKDDFYHTVKAFADAYNNTIDSGTSSQNNSIAKLTKQLKQVSSKYADELKDYGITFNEKGYMNIKESATKSISMSTYKDLIGKDSEYNKELSSVAKKLSQHIDITL